MGVFCDTNNASHFQKSVQGDVSSLTIQGEIRDFSALADLAGVDEHGILQGLVEFR